MLPSDRLDSELAEGVRRQDAEALAAAYDRYGHVAYALFLRTTRNPAVAEDLVQELFIRLWNRIGDFDESRGTLGVWLISIARNMAIDHVRSAQTRFVQRSRPIEESDRVSPSSKMGQPELDFDRVRIMDAALSRLNVNQRRVIQLAYIEGFSHSEIAARLDKPLGTVKGLMRSAIGRLQAYAGEYRAHFYGANTSLDGVAASK